MRAFLVLVLLLSPLMGLAAEPTAPTAPTAVDYNPASTPLSTVTVTSGDATDLRNEIQGITTCGVDVPIPVATYTLTSQITLPAVAGTCVGAATGRTAIAGSSGAHAVVGSGGRVAVASTDDYIVIRSANSASLPAAGTRINPSTDAANMPTIIVPAGSSGGFATADGAHHYRFIGLNVVTPSTACSGAACATNFDFRSPSHQTDSTTWAHHLYIERSWVHGDSTQGSLRGVNSVAANLGVMDSVVEDIFGTGNDRQAILLKGPGPFLVRNNRLSADSETVMMGDNTALLGAIPSDVTISRNFFYKPLEWIPFSATYPLSLTDAALTSAAIDAGGTCVTLTGKVPDAAWADGTKYFLAAADQSGGYYTGQKLITAVGSCNGANSLTLTSAHARTSQSGLTYRITPWNGKAGGSGKNHVECKQCRRVSITGNVMRNVHVGNQFHVFVFTPRGSGGMIQDVLIENNYVKDFQTALNLWPRPIINPSSLFSIAGDGTTNCGGGPCVQITFTGGVQCDCETGDLVQISANNDTVVDEDGNIGTNEAKGIWSLTKISSTVFTIPVHFVNAYTSGAVVTIFMQGSPTERFRVANNVFEEAGGYQVYGSYVGASGKSMFIVYTWPKYTTSDGTVDGTLSDTGYWNAKNISFEHNTCVAPAGTNINQRALEINEHGSAAYVYTVGEWELTNFTFRDNLCAFSGEGLTASNYGVLGITATMNSTSFTLSGTDATVAKFTDATHNWTNNGFYKMGVFGVSGEYTKSVGTGHLDNAIVADNAKIGFASYTTGTPATLSNFALNDLYTTGTCTTSTASLTVTCTGATIPATVVKGTPFKVNSDGRYCQVNVPSTNSFTLRASVGSCTATGYPSNNTDAAYTLGFKGWAHDGTDPGANMTTLMNAISGVAETIAGVEP